MKVLFLAPLPGPITGQSIASKLLFDELRRTHNVVSVNIGKNSFRQGIDSATRLFEILIFAFRILLNRHGCDLVYFTISESLAGNLKDVLFYCLLAGKLKNTVVHLHGGAGLRQLLSPKHRTIRAINKIFLRRVRRVVVLGERHLSIFDGIVERDRVAVVENFALDEFFVASSEIEEKYAEPVTTLRLLFLSNHLPGKGHVELADAVARLTPTERNRLEVHFAGGFESDDQQTSFLAKIDGLSCIHYHGTVHGAAKRRLLARTHLFCLPTYYPYEGQPISILEAYAAGCAVLTTNHSGIFDVFTPLENGFEVAKASPDSICEAIRKALDNPSLLAAIGRRNRALADSRFRAAIHLRNLMAVAT